MLYRGLGSLLILVIYWSLFFYLLTAKSLKPLTGVLRQIQAVLWDSSTMWWKHQEQLTKLQLFWFPILPLKISWNMGSKSHCTVNAALQLIFTKTHKKNVLFCMFFKYTNSNLWKSSHPSWVGERLLLVAQARAARGRGRGEVRQSSSSL